MIALHCLAAERRLENVVRQLPIRVVGIDRDQRVADDLAQWRQVMADMLAEAGLVVHLRDQVESADRDHLGAEHLAR